MGGDIQRSLCGVKASDNLEAGLIDGALGFLGILKRNANLRTRISAD